MEFLVLVLAVCGVAAVIYLRKKAREQDAANSPVVSPQSSGGKGEEK